MDTINYHSGDSDITVRIDRMRDELGVFAENKEKHEQYTATVKKEDYTGNNVVIKSSCALHVLFDMFCDARDKKDIPVKMTCLRIFIDNDADDFFCYADDVDRIYRKKGTNIFEYDDDDTDSVYARHAVILSVCYKPAYYEENFHIFAKKCEDDSKKNALRIQELEKEVQMLSSSLSDIQRKYDELRGDMMILGPVAYTIYNHIAYYIGRMSTAMVIRDNGQVASDVGNSCVGSFLLSFPDFHPRVTKYMPNLSALVFQSDRYQTYTRPNRNFVFHRHM